MDIAKKAETEKALQERKMRFRAIFDNAPIGIALIDCLTGVTVKTNKLLEKMLGYSSEEFSQMRFSEVTFPDDLAVEWPLYQQLIKGERESYQIEKRYLRKDHQIMWGRLHVSFITNQDQQGFALKMVEDITERKLAEDRLYEQMKENLRHTQELEAIVAISASIRKAGTPPELIEVLFDRILTTMNAQIVALGLLNGNSLLFQAISSRSEQWIAEVPYDTQNLFWRVLQEGRSRLLGFEEISAEKFLHLEKLPAYPKTGMVSPLKSGKSTIGVLFIGYENPVSISNEHLANAIADMAGNALHRMSIADTLERLVTDRTRELDTIYQVTSSASKSVELSTQLPLALDPILKALKAQIGAIILVDEKLCDLQVLAEIGLPPSIKRYIEQANSNNTLERWVLANQQPLLISDLAEDSRGHWLGQPEEHLTFVAIPMRVGGHVIGIVEIVRPAERQFDLDELTLLSFIADHLGLIVENDRLIEQVEHTAVLEERSRLARELHDSVTQSLYSLTLFADGGRRLAGQGDLASVQVCLRQLGQVSQQALKEMRLLVFELRSPALRSEGLAQAIHHRIDTVENRAGITARLDVAAIPDLPEGVEEALYRITLEALNNSLKHSHSRNISIHLSCEMNRIILCVADDGEGFDLQTAELNGGFGLTSMRERAKKLKGSLEILSTQGVGTKITANIPFPSPV